MSNVPKLPTLVVGSREWIGSFPDGLYDEMDERVTAWADELGGIGYAEFKAVEKSRTRYSQVE